MRKLLLGLLLFCSSAYSHNLASVVFLLHAVPPPIPNGVVLTPDHALLGADGELRTSVGDPPFLVTPLQWQIKPAGEIEYVTRHQGIFYRFHVRQADLPLNPAPADARAGVLSVTAENEAQAEQSAVLWAEWKSEPSALAGEMQGALLDARLSASEATTPYERPWNAKWTWLFHKNAFLRDGKIVYFTAAEGWEEEHWVRRTREPFTELTASSGIGLRHLSVRLPRGKTASLEIWVPFRPLEREVSEAVPAQ